MLKEDCLGNTKLGKYLKKKKKICVEWWGEKTNRKRSEIRKSTVDKN